MYPKTDRAHHLASVVGSGKYNDEIAATVGTAIEVISSIRELAVDLGINTELPDFMLGLYERLSAAGYLEQDNACLIEVFRDNA
jgi:hypothetical protein